MKNESMVLSDVTRVFMFEHWLRFYFVQDQGDDIRLELTSEQMEKIHSKYGELGELAERMNGEKLSPEACRTFIVDFLRDFYDGKKYPMGMVPQTLDQSQFQLELALFNVWSNLHEAQLEEGILGFEIWENFFKEWRESDQGRQVMLSMQVKDQGEEMSKTTN
jgi:hypothetical protein